MTSTNSNLIELSPSALTELRRLATEQADAAKAIRIGVKGGGCSGMTYILDYQEKQLNDLIFNYDGLQIAVSPAHAIYLEGVRLDFGTGLNNRGFIFENPNASETCGCGTSFAV
jgi:iron-sulfur cluster assembly protein